VAAVIGVPLAGADLYDWYDWIALRQVSDGGVAKVGDWWMERGHQVPGYVADALAELECRIRAQQDSRDGGHSHQPPSQPAGWQHAGGSDCRG
jgi:hypothetical protein